jgi:hypothetical protein
MLRCFVTRSIIAGVQDSAVAIGFFFLVLGLCFERAMLRIVTCARNFFHAGAELMFGWQTT